LTGVPAMQADWLSALRRYLLTAGILNLLWEIAHLPLYTISRTGSWREISFAVAHCTVGDLMIATLSLIIALCILGRRDWPSQGFATVAATTLVIGLAYTGYSEWLNTTVRMSWTYTELMPKVPFLEVGLSPVIQWIIVPAAALFAASGAMRTSLDR
jgi:hypothetical protein